MDSKILLNAKRDIPEYFKDFKKFWDSTTEFYTDEDLIDCYSSTLLFKNLKISLNHIGLNGNDEILNELHEDINSSFFYAYFGNYRSAYMHLRSVIELSLQLIYFIQHEVEYHQWKNADFIIKHDVLTKYLKKHPVLKNQKCENIINDITSLWITFSKHIHAESPVFFQTQRESSTTKEISREDFGKWKSNHIKTTYLINKLFIYFFRDKVNNFPTNNRDLLMKRLKTSDIEAMDEM
ncbi:hypothetical protein [uncultured Maribacter sp.]|uniref:hypothetical protein n=1 Tax=uncultured Maribacter sp. TaxID=431308 RepID=UPI0030EBF6A9|tara:strand:+ start:2199 stop:2909 length:711 start_codon:yes stop_codon:yes gene_type:complete